MNRGVSDLDTLLRSMEPVLHDGAYVYVVLPPGADLGAAQAVAMVREAEGITLIMSEADAARSGLGAVFRAAWITLNVHSDLQAVGLTAAFAHALADAGISCNVVAGAYHDHIFVPLDLAPSAMAALRGLQARAAKWTPP